MNDIIINGAEIKRRIIAEINSASQSIYLAMAWFTDRDIAAAIIEAKNRNITIDIVLSSNAQNETVKLMLMGANIRVHAFQTGDERGMMHHKFCLIDNKISINGSYNYSYNAANNNVENIHVSDEPSVYSQLFTEFERIRYNIDHNIALNASTKEVSVPAQVSESSNRTVQTVSPETFYQQLSNLVYSSAQISTDEYTKKGYQKSEESGGNIDIFEAEYKHIKEQIRVYATDDSLLSKKNVLLANILNVFEKKKAELASEKDKEAAAIGRTNELLKQQIMERLSVIKHDKLVLETGNQTTGEKGLLQIHKDIERNKLELKALEQTVVVKKFWSIGTVLVSGCLVVFTVYLSLFFASAVYKVLFESNVIRNALEAGANPGLPQLVDANAIIKIFRQQGALFGFIAIIFFLFPVLLSNIKMFKKEKTWVNNLLFWVGLLIFDISVAATIAFNTDKINSLLVGQESHLQLWEVIKHSEFWMIFVFGMMPLIITHYLIEYLFNAYQKSQKELVDAVKAKQIKILEEEKIDLESNRGSITNMIKQKDDAINEMARIIENLEKELNEHLNQAETKHGEYLKAVQLIFDDFNAKITSGRIFTNEILQSVISAFKTGFIDYLPTYYAEDEVARRVDKIEKTMTTS